MAKGKLIVIEGLDGCGKTTQTDLLVQYLHNVGYPVWQTHEYTNGPVGDLIRKYLQKEIEGDERIINMLYAPDRLDHITKKDGILDHLERGEIVVTDRYYLSSLAYYPYKSTKHAADWNLLFHDVVEWNRVNMDLAKPDLTIFLEVPPYQIIGRIKDRGEDPSVFETEEKLALIDNSYARAIRWLRSNNDEEIIRLNGTGPVDAIQHSVRKCVRGWLEYWNATEESV